MSQARLSKPELLARANAWTGKRYGLTTTAAGLEDLVDADLVPRLVRDGNEGLAPSYWADARHLRRLLQIKRLQSKRITNRDELKIQLYIRSYGVSFESIRSIARSKYIKELRRIMRPMRSSFIDNTAKEIGDQQLAKLRATAAPLDSRLAQSGLKISNKSFLSLLRESFSPIGGGLLGSLFSVKGPDTEISERVEQAFSAPANRWDEAIIFLRDFRQAMYHGLKGDLGYETPIALLILVMIVSVEADSHERQERVKADFIKIAESEGWLKESTDNSRQKTLGPPAPPSGPTASKSRGIIDN